MTNVEKHVGIMYRESPFTRKIIDWIDRGKDDRPKRKLGTDMDSVLVTVAIVFLTACTIFVLLAIAVVLLLLGLAWKHVMLIEIILFMSLFWMGNRLWKKLNKTLDTH